MRVARAANSLAVFAFALLASCGGEDAGYVLEPWVQNPSPSFGAYPQCDGIGLLEDAATIRAFRQQVPAGAKIRCATKAGFSFQGQIFELVYVGYGHISDCSSGCFSSSLCTLDSGYSQVLFQAYFTHVSEAPRSLAAECPALVGASDASTDNCNPQVSGRQHPIVQDPVFRNYLLDAQDPDPFRFCANNLP